MSRAEIHSLAANIHQDTYRFARLSENFSTGVTFLFNRVLLLLRLSKRNCMFHHLWYSVMERSISRLWTRTTASAALSIGLFLASCSSSNDVAVNPTASNDEVAATLLVSNQPIEQWEAEDNQVLPLSPPVGEHDRGNDGEMSPNDPVGGRRPLPLPCLGLTPEQMEQLRQLMAELHSADSSVMASIQDDLAALRQREQAAWEAYRQATAAQRQQLVELYRQFRAQVDSIRRLIGSGSLNRSDAGAILRQLVQDFKNARKAIIDSRAGARAELRAALNQIAQERKMLMDSIQAQLDANYQRFLRSVADILTPEQLVIWQRWLNGEDPCKGPGPRG